MERHVPEKYIRAIVQFKTCTPGMQNSSARCGRGEQQLLGGGRTYRFGLKHLFLLLMDVLTEDVRKDVHESIMFEDDIVLCGDDETDMTEYLET